jgi:hypothetical protein
MEAGRQLLLQAFGELEDRLLQAGAGARQRRRRRYLLIAPPSVSRVV